jgi:hypothetical protein
MAPTDSFSSSCCLYSSHRGKPVLPGIGINGKPGAGFFAWAKKLGYLQGGQDEQAFWENECKQIYKEWKAT